MIYGQCQSTSHDHWAKSATLLQDEGRSVPRRSAQPHARGETGRAASKGITIGLEARSRIEKRARPRGGNPEIQRRRNPKDPGPTRQKTGRHASRQKANERLGEEPSGQARRQAGRQASRGEEERRGGRQAGRQAGKLHSRPPALWLCSYVALCGYVVAMWLSGSHYPSTYCRELPT